MGLFLDLAGFLAPEEQVRAAVAAKAADAKVTFHSVQPDRTLMLFDEPTGDFRFTQELSATLGVPTFAFHIHDGDLWMYEFYVAGELVDKFNTCPSYWKELPPDEEAEWRGNAGVLAQHWKSLNPESIQRYLVHLDPDSPEAESKAYPEDKFAAWDCWQLTDFLLKLGIPYPEEED
jgi:hypothetical protein